MDDEAPEALIFGEATDAVPDNDDWFEDTDSVNDDTLSDRDEYDNNDSSSMI